MKPFIIIDRFILNRVEQLSHCLQKTFGLGCHKWAQLCYGAFIANAIRWVADGLLSHKLPSPFIWILIILISLVVYLVLMPMVERIYNEMNALGLSNLRKIRTSSIVSRLSNFAFIALYVSLANYTWAFNFVLIGLSEYFEACDDLPPGKSRVRKFVDAMKAFGLKPVGVEQ